MSLSLQDVPGLLGRGATAEARGGPGVGQFGAGHAVPGRGSVLSVDGKCNGQGVVRLYDIQGHAQVDTVRIEREIEEQTLLIISFAGTYHKSSGTSSSPRRPRGWCTERWPF